MMKFSLWKQLKRRLLRSRRPLWMLGGLALMLFVGWCAIQSPEAVYADELAAGSSIESITDALVDEEEPFSIKLHRIYVCGEEIQPLGMMKSKQIIQLLTQHPEWSAVLDDDRRTLLLEQRVDDLSSHCKTHAQFGLDKDDNLSLFDGEPKQEKIIQTFFQLDIGYMESSLPQDKLDQLTQGIRVSDINEYNSVLSTFSDYAVERNEKVMKPAY